MHQQVVLAQILKMALFPTGNLGIGVGTTDAGYKSVIVNGTARVQEVTGLICRKYNYWNWYW
jgi:hypothetical protein